MKTWELKHVTGRQWNQLNSAWVLFFVTAGFLNIYVAYNYEEATWVKFKVFGLTALTFIFMLGQSIWLAVLIGEDQAETKEEHD